MGEDVRMEVGIGMGKRVGLEGGLGRDEGVRMEGGIGRVEGEVGRGIWDGERGLDRKKRR